MNYFFNCKKGIRPPSICSKHLLSIMKSFVIVSLLYSQTIVAGISAQSVSVNLSLRNPTVAKVIEKLHKQTGYEFAYDAEILTKHLPNVAIEVYNEKIENVLSQIFNGTTVDYKVLHNRIFLKEKKEAPLKKDFINFTQQTPKTKTITGSVFDERGESIIGATIIEKGNSTNGTTTDIDGHFSLNVALNAILKVSYVGYETQEIDTSEGNAFTITLKEDSKTLDELVVVGYGIQKKVNVIGSIATVDSKTLESRTAPNVTNMLTGQLSGVTIIQNGGRPGNDAGTIRIRGEGSFGASPAPLVLIDGVPGNLNNLNPSDIDAISVLKDASSAAIYGSRAANGVILVQTKNGRQGKVTVNYNGYFGWNKASELPDLLHSYEYAENFNLATGTEAYSADDIHQMKSGTNLDVYADEMYLDDILGGTGFQTNHELSVNGGNSNTQYLVSLGYLTQNGLLEKNKFNKYNGRLNLSVSLNEKLRLTTRLSGIITGTEEPAIPGGFDGGSDMTHIVAQALRYPGIWSSIASDGTWGDGPKLLGTPKAWLKSPSFHNQNAKVLTSLGELTWTPIESLKIKIIGGYNFTNLHKKTYRSTLKLHGGRTVGPSELKDVSGNTEYKTLQLIAEYGHSFKKHDFSLLGGYTWEDEEFRDIEGFRNNYPSNDVPFLNAGATEGQQSLGGGYDWAMLSYFGRLTYNYDQRYLFESTLRYDGSSRFPSKNRFGLFPSLAVGWRISEEPFFKKNRNLKFINNLKIKASAGSLGNNNIGNYPYQQVYELDTNRSYIFGGQVYSGAAVTTYKDPSLTWEKTKTIDIGFESNLWSNKLSFNMSYFYRKTTDILYKPNASYSAIFGLNLSPVNTGSLQNTGWEFEIGHHNKIGNISYFINGNFSIIRNKVVSLGIGNVEQENGMIGNGSDLFIGYPMQMYYGYKTDGVFLNEKEISEWYDQSKIANKSQAGDLRYVDVSGDNIVDEKDKVYLGSRIPKYTFGVNIGASWRGFDCNALLQGVAGVKGLLNEYAGFAFYQQGNIQRWQADGTWTRNQSERYPAYPRLEVMSNAGTPSTLASDYWVLDASYIKVRNVQLGYTFPKSIVGKLSLSNLRLYFSSENPLSFNKYRKGWDPEINTYGPYYPILSTYTFGINIKF